MAKVAMDIADSAYPHGTERGYYRMRHRCGPCARAHTKAGQLRDLAADRETPAAMLLRTHEHLLMLLDYGSVNDICRAASGVRNVKAVVSLASGEAQYAWRATMTSLLATTPEQVTGSVYMAPDAERRLAIQRVRSMQALGWSITWQRQRIGVDLSGFACRYPQVTRAVVGRIAALAVEVGDRRGPSALTASRARRSGWYVPGAYDEAGNLIPGAALEMTSARDRLAGRVLSRRAEVIRLHVAGYPTAEIAKRLGVSANVVLKDKRRYVAEAA